MWIQRWDRDEDDMHDHPEGDYVLFADHEQVVADLEAKLSAGGGIAGAAMEQITKLATERDALRAELAAKSKDAARYAWLRDNASCSISITHNDNHTYYRSAEDTLADDPGDYYSEVSEQDRAKMIEQDSIWTIHEYPHTPVGFNVWHAASLGEAIDSAMGEGNGR